MNIEKLFNKEVMTLDTYIMFRLKEATAKLKPELIAKNRAPISLSMGALISIISSYDRLKRF
ncbi:MAG: hypothetical protein ACLSA2_11865 [Candidatus Gastranaerophilaceae bacterium]